MKILCTLLLALSLSANASENNNFENLKNDLKNTELYQSHYITVNITKDEKKLGISSPSHRVVEFVLSSPTGEIVSHNESINQNNDFNHNHLIIKIYLNQYTNQQILTFIRSDLLFFKEITVNNLTLTLPVVEPKSWSMPITKDSMKKTWSDDLGNTYNLTYIGYK